MGGKVHILPLWAPVCPSPAPINNKDPVKYDYGSSGGVKFCKSCWGVNELETLSKDVHALSYMLSL